MERLVSTEWLGKELGAPDLRILDARVLFRYLDGGGFELRSGRSLWEAGHIPTAAHVDIPGDLSDAAAPVPLMAAPPEAFGAAMGRAGVGDGARVVIYDDEKHMWAARLWWMLRAYGFDDAAVLDGGFDAWTAEGRAITRDAAPPAVARFVARPRAGTFVTKDQMLDAMDDEDVVIVDALLGVDNVAVYDGSLLEWTADPSLPMTTEAG